MLTVSLSAGILIFILDDSQSFDKLFFRSFCYSFLTITHF